MGQWRGTCELWAAVWLLLLVVLSVPASAAALPPVPLRAGEDAPPLAPYVGYFQPGTQSDLPLVPNPPEERLLRVTSRDIQFGAAGGDVLAFVRVKNVSARGGSWIFTTGRGTLTAFALYRIGQDGPPRLLLDGSDRSQVRENLFAYQAFSHDLSLAPGESATLAFHMRTEGSTWMPLAIQTFPSFFADRRENLVLVAAVVAAALILILFNVIFYAITGKREFVWLGAAQLVFTLNTVHAEGYLTIFLLHDWPLLAQWIGEILRSLYAVLMVQFGRIFLETRRNFPRSDLMMKTAIGCGLLFLGSALLALALGEEGWTELRFACWIYLALVGFALPPVAIAAYRQLGGEYWPLVLSWTSLAGFILYGAIAMSGLIGGLPVSWHLIGPVGLAECALATLALGLHLRSLQQERLASGVALQASLERQVITSREAARLAEERASALAAVRDQERLLHASGHDSRQVLVALNAVADYASANAGQPIPPQVLGMIRSSAAYLRDIVDTTRSAPIVAYDGSNLVALGQFGADQPLRQLEKIYAPLLARRQVRLDVTCPQDLSVLSDRALLARALSNLVSNAARFTAEGTVILSACADQDCILFAVQDTGPGLPAGIAEKLRDGSGSHLPSGDGQGSGSGLRSCARIAAALSGELILRPAPHGGTLAAIAVPLLQPAGHRKPLDLAGLRKGLPDIMLIDLDAPAERQRWSDGASAAPDVPAVGLATDASAQTRDLARNAGLSLVLTRPFDAAVLEHPLVRALQARGAPSPARS